MQSFAYFAAFGAALVLHNMYKWDIVSAALVGVAVGSLPAGVLGAFGAADSKESKSSGDPGVE